MCVITAWPLWLTSVDSSILWFFCQSLFVKAWKKYHSSPPLPITLFPHLHIQTDLNRPKTTMTSLPSYERDFVFLLLLPLTTPLLFFIIFVLILVIFILSFKCFTEVPPGSNHCHHELHVKTMSTLFRYLLGLLIIGLILSTIFPNLMNCFRKFLQEHLMASASSTLLDQLKTHPLWHKVILTYTLLDL